MLYKYVLIIGSNGLKLRSISNTDYTLRGWS